MQSILALLKRYSNLLLFLVIQGICFILLVSNNNFHRAAFLNSSKSIAGWTYETKNSITGYFSLSEENARLTEENARLKQILFNADSLSIQQWKTVLDSSRNVQFEYLTALSVNSSTRFEKNYLTLNIGANNGVSQTQVMGVVGPDGIVGFTRKGCTGNYTSVVSVLHANFILNVEHEKSGQTGLLRWESDDDRYTTTLNDMPKYLDLSIGDTIVTSGKSGRFPRGEMVGTIVDLKEKSGTNFYRVKVKLSTDFNQVHNVHVIRNVEALEKDSIELNNEQIIKPIP